MAEADTLIKPDLDAPEVRPPAPWAPRPEIVSLPWTKDPVSRSLRTIRRRERLYHLIAVMLGCACLGLAFVTGAMFADRIWEFASFTRISMLHIAGAGVLLSGLTFAALVLLRARNPLRYAREIDRSLGLTDEALITYVDLRRRKELGAGEREVAELLAGRALERIEGLDSDRVVDIRALNWCARILGVMALVLVLFGVYCGSSFWTSLKRTLLPWQEIAPPRETMIAEVLPGDAKAIVGEPVKFEIRAAGRLPRTATLRYRIAGDAGETEAALAPSGGGRYGIELPGFTRPVVYRVICNDCEKGPYTLTPVDRPLVTAVNLRVLPPAYAPNAPAREVSGGHVQAVAGSRIEVRAAVNQPPMPAEKLPLGKASAWLDLRGQRMPMTANGQSLQGMFLLERDASYQIGYLAASGYESAPGVVYLAKVVPDAPPTAELRREGAREDEPAAPDAVVILRAIASDDMGLRKATVCCALDDKPMRDIDCSPETTAASLNAVVSVDLAKLGARSGQVLICKLVVEDNSPMAQRAESKAVRIPIQGPAAGKGNAENARKNLEKRDPFADLVRKLKESEKPKAVQAKTGNKQEPKENADSLERLKEDEEDLMRRLQRQQDEGDPAKEKLEELADEQQRLLERLNELMEKEDKKDTDSNSKPNDNEHLDNINDSKDQDSKNNSNKNDKDASDSDSSQNDQNSKDSKESRDSKDGENSQSGQNGSQKSGQQDSGQKDQGEQGESGQKGEQGQQNGQGQKGEQGQQSGQGQKGEQGQQSGEGQKGGQGQKGEQGKGSGQCQNPGQGQCNNPGQGDGQCKGQGQNKGGQPNSSKQGGGGAGSPGGGGNGMGGTELGQPKDLKDLKSNEPGKSDDAASGDLRPIRNQLSEAAARMRKGQLDNETMKLMREAVNGLNATGRRFSEDDGDKVARNLAKQQAKPDANEVRKPPTEERVKEAPEGRAREALSGKNGEMKTMQSRPGEMQEDNLRRLIEQGQAKVVPEYRKPVEDYYKAVSK